MIGSLSCFSVTLFCDGASTADLIKRPARYGQNDCGWIGNIFTLEGRDYTALFAGDYLVDPENPLTSKSKYSTF
jgi:hypothetical protein